MTLISELLLALLFLPLVAAAIVAMLGKNEADLVRRISLVSTIVCAVLSFIVGGAYMWAGAAATNDKIEQLAQLEEQKNEAEKKQKEGKIDAEALKRELAEIEKKKEKLKAPTFAPEFVPAPAVGSPHTTRINLLPFGSPKE